MATLYVGNLEMDVDESDIYGLFGGFDVRAVHMKFRYCFVTFEDAEQAIRALVLNGIELFGRNIRVQWARSNYDRATAFYQNSPQNLTNRVTSLESLASSQSSDSLSSQPVSENTLLECEICFVRFDYHAYRPRSLPCGHSLCSLCITKSLRAMQDTENNCLLCPFCRTSCGPHKTRVGQFPETFFILKMLEVEAEKSKKGVEIANKELQEKKREIEEKRREEEKREKDRKKQEEDYLTLQKKMGLDSTVSGLMSCKDHLESLEDLHERQVSKKFLLKSQRKILLEELNKIESEIMELSEQMFNIEVWMASGKNLITKFDNIQENLQKDDNKENIESCYDAAECCCLATQRWSEGSLPEINKMNLVMKQKQKSRLGFLFEKTSENVPDFGSKLEISSEEPAFTASYMAEPITKTLTPFMATNTSPSSNSESNINQFQANLLGTTTAVSSMNIFSSVSPTSVTSISPLSANEKRTSNGSSTQLTSPVTNDSLESIVSITQTVLGPTKYTTQLSYLTNTAKTSVSNIGQTRVTSALRLGNSNSVSFTSANMNNINSTGNTVPTNSTNLNLIASSVEPHFSSCKTSTLSSPFSMGNLSHPSTIGVSNIPTSVAEPTKQITVKDSSLITNSSSASVRPKVNSALASFPNISEDYLSQSGSSLCSTNIARRTTFDEQKEVCKKVSNSSSVCSSNLSDFSGFRFGNINSSVNKVSNNATLATSDFTTSTTSNLSDFSGFRFGNINSSVNMGSNNATLATSAFTTSTTTTNTTTTTTNSGISASLSKSLNQVGSTLFPSPFQMPSAITFASIYAAACKSEMDKPGTFTTTINKYYKDSGFPIIRLPPPSKKVIEGVVRDWFPKHQTPNNY